MMKYICLLRGINVSGKNLIKMEYVRDLFLDLEFRNVQTYIQSGNIVFSSEILNEKTLTKVIEEKLVQNFGSEIITFIRNFDEWEVIALNNPFQNYIDDENYKFYVTFFNQEPDKNLRIKLTALFNKNENISFSGREMYSMIKKDPDIKELFSNNLIENKLRLSATTRNWNTILKVLDFKKQEV